MNEITWADLNADEQKALKRISVECVRPFLRGQQWVSLFERGLIDKAYDEDDLAYYIVTPEGRRVIETETPQPAAASGELETALAAAQAEVARLTAANAMLLESVKDTHRTNDLIYTQLDNFEFNLRQMDKISVDRVLSSVLHIKEYALSATLRLKAALP